MGRGGFHEGLAGPPVTRSVMITGSPVTAAMECTISEDDADLIVSTLEWALDALEARGVWPSEVVVIAVDAAVHRARYALATGAERDAWADRAEGRNA